VPMNIQRILAMLALPALLVGCGSSESQSEEPMMTGEPIESEEALPPSEPVPVQPQPAPGEPGGPESDPMNPADPQPMGQGAASNSDVSREEVQKFSDAQVSLLELQQQLTQRARSGEDQTALQAELQERVPEIVEDAGLTLERFDEIAQQASVDADLRSRVERAMEARL